MTSCRPRSPQAPAHDAPSPSLRRLYTGVLTLVLGFSIPIIGMQALRAEITGGQGASSSSMSRSDDPRSCTSAGTMFMGLTRPIEVINLFQARMSAVVAEREQLLRRTSDWECFGGAGGIQPPPSPQLQVLASELPGWHYKYTTDVGGVGTQTIWVPKPVPFESFASVILEFQREYECKLAEMQPESVLAARTDQDLDGPDGAANPGGGTYCCSQNSYLCVDQASFDEGGAPIICDPSRYQGPDPVCNLECTISDDFGHLGIRTDKNWNRMTQERIRARIAVERTINTLRSFEQAVMFTVQMSCFQRAGIDLKNELSLLADGVSCMPKIWDSVNSLHDLKSQSPPEL